MEPNRICSRLVVKGSTVSDISVLEGGAVRVEEDGYIDDVYVYPGGIVVIGCGCCYGNIHECGGYIDFDGIETNTVNHNTVRNLELIDKLATVHEGTKFKHVTISGNSKLHIRGKVYALKASNGENTEINVYDGGKLKYSKISENATVIAHSGSTIHDLVVDKGATLEVHKGAILENVTIEEDGIISVEVGFDAKVLKHNVTIKNTKSVMCFNIKNEDDMMVENSN
jgi:hypothetical protein